MEELGLADIEAFLAVARARGFRGAAVQGNVSASALSAALRRLETRLGVRLLNRTTRSVTPTEAGQRLIERLAPLVGDIGSALDSINAYRDSPTVTLRLNVPSIVARHVLPPIAARFLQAHPGITLDVVTDDAFVDMLAAGCDAGIRYEERMERDMIALPIGPRTQRFVAAASPAYLAARGRPARPQDLVDHACLRHRFPSGAIAVWEFERRGKKVRIRPDGPLLTSTTEMQVHAAVAGLGIIHTFEEFMQAPLASGDLVPVLEEWCQRFTGPLLYYPSRTHMPAPLRAFVDFIKHEGTQRGDGEVRRTK
jgi:DNA-binding transcriptional LysR family regulator